MYAFSAKKYQNQAYLIHTHLHIKYAQHSTTVPWFQSLQKCKLKIMIEQKGMTFDHDF